MALVAETSDQKSVLTKQRSQTQSSKDFHQVDNTFRLTTPENISFEYQLAGPFRRVFPYLLDVVIVCALYLALVFLVSLAISLIGGAFGYMGLAGVAEFLTAIGIAVMPIGLFLMYWFYGAYLETYYNGRTLGKSLARLRVISTDGHAIDGTQATLRNLFRGIDLMPLTSIGALVESNDQTLQAIFIPTAIFGLVVMSLSPKFQRLGDLVAGTMVVNEEGDRNPHVHTFSDSRVPQLAELIPTSFYVSSSLSKAVAVYVERREQLGVARAGEIAAKLAGSLLERFGLAADTDPDLLICSLYYKVFVGESNLQDDLPIASSQTNPYSAIEAVPTGKAIADMSPYERPQVTESLRTMTSPINPSNNSELE